MELGMIIMEQYRNKIECSNINGSGNIWLVKPEDSSRGRGIRCFNNLNQILDLVLQDKYKYVIQKYIETPLLIYNRKFDIRQWVLVTNFNPLQIWVYNESYLRFSGERFDLSNLENKFIHLTNQAVQKKNKKQLSQQDLIQGELEIKENMMYLEQFRQYLINNYGKDMYTDYIKPRINEIVYLSVTSVSDQVSH